jgi:hypothetical protein
MFSEETALVHEIVKLYSGALKRYFTDMLL